MDKNHGKKILGAILAGGFICVYILLIVLLVFTVFDESNRPAVIIFGGVLLSIIAAIVYQIIARIKEIKGGEEDDLSKY